MVLGEEIETVQKPLEAAYGPTSVSPDHEGFRGDANALRQAISELAGGAKDGETLDELVRRCGLLWDLNQWLVRAPLSASAIAEKLRSSTAARANVSMEEVLKEVESALV